MTTKPRVRVAIAFARSFASGLVQNAEPTFQQEGTTLTDDEIKIVEEEILRIHKRLEASIDQEMLALATPDPI
jgi:hypothetical protein